MTALQLQNLVTIIGAILVMAGLGGVAWLGLTELRVRAMRRSRLAVGAGSGLGGAIALIGLGNGLGNDSKFNLFLTFIRTENFAKMMQANLAFFWPRAASRLYEEPKNLVAHGLATLERS